MALYRSFLQTLGALALAGAVACGGGSKGTSAAAETTARIGGTVTYQRVPLATDTNGVPTGLLDASVPANLKSLPARGVNVRAYQQVEQTQTDGTKVLVWTYVSQASTDATGVYALTVAKGRPTMVEVLSSFNGGDSILIHLIAEPGGISSTTPPTDRLRYGLRKAADGSAPAGVATPSSVINGDTTLNFSVGLTDPWWVVTPSYRIATKEVPLLGAAQLETSYPGRTAGQGSGSRILAIGDTIASFQSIYGSATPGANLDLHYWMGRSEPRGSFVEFDRSVYPAALDTSTGSTHFFGSLRGDAANDDAWDEGVILPLIARGVLYAGNQSRTFAAPLTPLPPPGAALTDLSPDMARIEGLADAMAANILKSPYLADTQGTTLAAPVLDIRSIAGLGTSQLTPYSAPAIRAFAWEVILKANSIASPGTPTTWATLNPAASKRFFQVPTTATNGATDATARDIEPLNIFSQITRLKEAKGTSDPVDLAPLFPDATLTSLAAPFGLTWPRPTTGPTASFMTDWGTDPNSTTTPLPTMSLSMAKAVQVNGAYPNLSQGEVLYAGFLLNADKRYVLSATLTPALAAGSQVVVDLPRMGRTFSFTGAGGAQPALVIPVNATAPYFHPVRVRLLSPAAVQPDVTLTLALTPAP